MVKKLTNKMLGIVTLLMMLMMTSLSAHADYVLKGSFNDWGEGMAMLQDGDTWTLTKDFAVGEEFKFQEDGTWVGAQADGSYYGVTSSVLNNGTLITLLLDAGQNLRIETAGRYTIVIDANRKMRIGTKAPVTKKTATNGTFEVNPTQAIPGQIVTITAAPADGYYIEVGNITVEKTINGGSAQAPGLKADGPGVGQFVTDIQAGEAPNTFTFAMPESPYGALVSAEFQACIPITAAMIQPNPIPDQDYTGSQIKPAIVVMDGETTLVEGTDYTLEYGANVEPGEGTIIVTGKGKYTSTVTVTFTIKKGVHNVIVDENIVNGEVKAEPTSGVQGDWITLTITPATGYKLKTLSVTYGEGNTITPNEENKFQMPDADVNVTAEFEAIDYTITVAEIQNGTVEPSKTTANVGDVITLEVTPLGDYELETLTYTVEGGQPVTIENNQFTMPAGNVTINATFTALPVTYKINYGKQGNPWTETGSITMTKDETTGKWVTDGQVIPAGFEAVLIKMEEGKEDVTMQAFATDQYWITDANLVNHEPLNMGTGEGYVNIYFPNAGNYTFSYNPVDKRMFVDGFYVYNINIAETENGTVTTDPASPVAAGTQVTINATPNTGYEVGTITVMNGETPVTVENSKFEMPAADVSVTVTFVPKEFEITVNPSENGSVSIVGKELVQNKANANYNEEITLTVTPAEGYEVETLTYTVEGGEAVPIQDNKFTMPAGNVTINATFKKATYTVTVTNPNTEVTVDKATAQMGDKVTITITPAAGYEVDAITVMAGETPVTVENNQFTMPAANVTVTVTFKAKEYEITVAPSENGTVTIVGKELVDNKANASFGETVTLTVTPDDDCVLESLTVINGETPVEVTNNNTFVMPAGDVTVTAVFRALTVTYWVAWGVTNTETGKWDTENYIEMTKDGNNWVASNKDMAAGNEFKIVKRVQDGENDPTQIWYGTPDNNMFYITAAYLAEPTSLPMVDGAPNLFIENDGTYTFKFTPDKTSPTLIVEGAIDYKITVNNTTPDYGTVTAPAKAKAGDDVTLTVTPTEGYRVDVLTVTYGEGENITTVPVTDNKFKMPAADVTVTVTFTRILTNNALTWNVPAEKGILTATVEGENVENGGLVQEGKPVVVTVTPTAEWTVNTVTVDCGNSDLAVEVTKNADGTYTFTMPAAPAEIKVDFTAVQHNITVNDNPYVDVTLPDPATAAAGENVTITVTPKNSDDFVVTGVTVNNGAVTVTDNEDGTYTFTMPEGADGVTIDVVVEAKIQGVSFTAERNWATYIGAYNLVKPEGVKVYVVNRVVSNAVDITEIDYIPANVGVLLYGTSGEDLTTPLYTGTTGTYTSKLAGSATDSQPISAGYVLYNNNFIRSEEGTLAAHRCYLPASEVAGAPHMLKIGYDGDVPTAIETILASGNVAGIKYVNMSGMTSDQPFCGFNIAVVTFTDGTTQTLKFVK